jgi:hypothetical protein
MAQPSLLIKNLLNATREEYFYHSDRVNQLSHNDYPFQCCLEFLDKLLKIDKAVLLELDRIEKEVIETSEYSLKESIEKIQRYGQLVGILHYILTFFEVGNREYIPIGTLVSIKKLIRKVDRISAFTLVPIFDYNYIYQDLMFMLKKALRDALPDKIDEILAGMPEKYAVFGFPLVMKNNVVLNVILAHEVGHFIDDSAKISKKILEQVSLDQKKIEKFAKRLEKVKFGEREDIQLTYFISPDTLRADIMKIAAIHISDWLKELVADLLAFHCFGPAYLQSVSDFLMIMVKIDEASGDHPSPRFRIKLLLEEFKDKGYSKILDNKSTNKQLKEYIGFFSELNKAIDDLPQTTTDEFQEIVIDAVKKVIPALKKEVTKFTAELIYTPKEFEVEVNELSKHLDLIVPPVELEMGKTANPVSITNSGAFYKMILINKLYKVFNTENSIDEAGVRDKLHSLILKALELGDIGEHMKSVLEE